jgi:hypothetical protein
MLKPENEKDKRRFEKMKETEIEHGRDTQSAIDVAARETKELREREGRAKHAAKGKSAKHIPTRPRNSSQR